MKSRMRSVPVSMKLLNNDKQATTDVSDSPRGDCYDWCRIDTDGSLTFGSEVGNYAGGKTLSRRYVFTVYKGADGLDYPREYRDDDVTEAIYLEAVRRKMIGIVTHQPLFFMNIVELLIKNNATIWIDRLRQWIYDKEVQDHEERFKEINNIYKGTRTYDDNSS